MQSNLSVEGLYINDFHRENSMAAQRAVKQMSLHPYSRQQKIEQIQMLRKLSASTKENANCDIRINTPELRQGGTRKLTTDIKFV